MGGVSYCSTQGQDLVDNVRERSGGVDGDATSRNVRLRAMQPEYEVPFRLPARSSPFVLPPVVEPASEGFGVDLEHEDAVEQVNELREVSRSPTEERHRLALICDERLHFVDPPKVVIVNGKTSDVLHRCPGLRITLVREFAIAVNDVVTAPCQLLAHRGLPGSGTSFNEEVSPAHSEW
ncbi:hypothetical protein ABH924_001296 [Arthrobacter sp. GAS37]